MGKSDVTSISTFECRNVLDTIQNEYDQLQKEENSLSKLHEDLADLIAQRNVLAKRKGFNEKNCIICCLAFNLLFKRKLLCQDCGLWVCRSCSIWDNFSKQWQCQVCEKQKLLDVASSEWICNRIKINFANFNAAKSLQNFCRHRRISDSENDSGYGTAGDFMPLMKFLSSHSLNKDLKMTDVSSHDEDCEEDEDIGDEEELLEIQDSIETILEGLLGGTLEDALVDQLYPNSHFYLNLFDSYHNKLVRVIENLSRALQKALHNLPAENGITPTTAHAALKNIIADLVDDCQNIPSLQHSSQEDLEIHNASSFHFATVISSYDSLVAAAVINKVVEESQSKFKPYAYSPVEEKLESRTGCGEDGELFNNVLNSTSFDLPVECVCIEEIEEITQEFTDSEDDKLSSISKYSNSLQSYDETGMPKQPDLDNFINLDYLNDIPTPFPEFGCDLIEDQVNEDCQAPFRSLAVTTWEENWLFRKKKRLPLYSNLKYQLLTYCDEPPSMLIPCPSESSEMIDHDELSSELSETHSAGSLEFSSDAESLDTKELELSLQHQTSKSKVQTFTNSSPPILSTEKLPIHPQPLASCHLNVLNDNEASDLRISEKLQKEDLKDIQATQPKIDDKHQISKNHNTYHRVPDKVVEESFVETPPRPGTIAEREHKKWLNAIPLKHNPYSAENISKRPSYNKKTGLKEPASSFEEFERKLSISSDTNDSPLNKVNCGPKSIDCDLYKRDYYVNKAIEASENLYALQKSAKHLYATSGDCLHPLSDEALNSFEEKVYVRSGKVFTLENRVKRLEREIKEDNSLSPEMPKKLFSSNQSFETIPSGKPVLTSNKTEMEKFKKTKPCRKVHSLTARSLSREFRNLAKQNIPKPMNRTVPVSLNMGDESEREVVCSPESAQSSLSTAHGDNGHGYTSDESNTSSHSTSKPKSRRHISRSILERATYWERRAEQGLLSDASVSEEFPAIDMNNE